MAIRKAIATIIGVLAILSSMVVSGAQAANGGAEKVTVFITSQDPGAPVPGVRVERSLSAIGNNAALEAVVLDNAALDAISDNDAAQLSALVQRGIAVLTLGHGLQPNHISKRLGLNAKQDYTVDAPNQVVVDGVVLRSGGYYHSFHVVTPDKVVDRVKLLGIVKKMVSDTNVASPSSDVTIQSCPSWITEGSTSNTWTSSGFGTYVQTAAEYSLDPYCDGDSSKDYWRFEIQNTSQAGGTQWYKANSATDPGLSQAIVQYGPAGGSYGPNSYMTWTLSYPAPSVSYNVYTASTTVTNLSDLTMPRIRHEVAMPYNSTEAKTTYTWEQSMNTSTAEGQGSVYYYFPNNLYFQTFFGYSQFFANWSWTVYK